MTEPTSTLNAFGQRVPAGWSWGIALFGALSLLVIHLLLPAIPQEAAYHHFVDNRPLWDVPHALNVLSNLPFLLIGWLGLRALKGAAGPEAWVWRGLFAAIALTAFGSAWYHWQPDSQNLVWDRLPIALGFMLLFALVLHRHLAFALLPSVAVLCAAALAAIGWWAVVDDLRAYGWVQFFPILLLPLICWRFPAPKGQQQYLWAMLFWYAVAKLLEHGDAIIFDLLLGVLSGHSLKHLAAAAAVYQLVCYVRMVYPRGQTA